jgi:hypothetical protein
MVDDEILRGGVGGSVSLCRIFKARENPTMARM